MGVSMWYAKYSDGIWYVWRGDKTSNDTHTRAYTKKALLRRMMVNAATHKDMVRFGHIKITSKIDGGEKYLIFDGMQFKFCGYAITV